MVIPSLFYFMIFFITLRLLYSLFYYSSLAFNVPSVPGSWDPFRRGHGGRLMKSESRVLR